MKRLIFIGPQGAGKGTIAAHVCPHFEIPHISTGDMFREAIKKETELGLLAKKYIDEGSLVPDDVTVQLVKERITRKDCFAGFLLDGFPRTLAQAEALGKEVEIDTVVVLEAPEDVLMQRLSGRRICRHCGKVYHTENIKPKKEGVCDVCGGELYQRDDDKAEAIKKRLELYSKETAPLIEFYEKKGLVKKVNAAQDVEKVAAEAIAALS